MPIKGALADCKMTHKKRNKKNSQAEAPIRFELADF